MKPTDAAYLAGFIDGEGSIYAQQHGNGAYTIVLRITNTEQDVLEWAARMLGGKVYAHPAGKAHWKSGYQLWVGQKPLARVLPDVLPYMKVKHRQAKLMLKLAALPTHTGGRGGPSTSTPTRERICLQIKALNRRGQR